MNLDIDRLHKVFHGELKGYGVGKTTAVCYQALGYIQVDNKKVFIIVDNHLDVKQVSGLLYRVLLEARGICFNSLRFFEIVRIHNNNNNYIHYRVLIEEEDNIDYKVGYKDIIICSRSDYEYKLEFSGGEHLLLFDFNEGLYEGLNSAQNMWNKISERLGGTKESWDNFNTQMSKEFGMKVDLQINMRL